LRAFTDTREALRRYDAGEFCQSEVGVGGALLSSFYGETCILADYFKTNWVRFLEFREFSSERDEQVVIVVRKP
jgi:hypothetical protein